MNAYFHAGAVMRVLADLTGWMAVRPEIDETAIANVAHLDDAHDRIGVKAGNQFDAVNRKVECSEEVERVHRELASAEGDRAKKVFRALLKEPELVSTTTKDKDAKPAGWTLFNGTVALIFLGIVLSPILLVVAQGVAQSEIFDSINADWRLGIPFGVPVLAGIIASGLLRHTLSHNGQAIYDRAVSVAGLMALAAWAAGYAWTFLVPEGVDEGFGGGATDSVVDLRLFYGVHLALEIAAGLGLAAMAERAFMAGKTVVHKVNKAVAILSARYDAIRERQLFHIHCAEACKDVRERMTAARAEHVAANLDVLEGMKLRRAAAIADASARFSHPHDHH